MNEQRDNLPPIVGPTAKWREIMGKTEQLTQSKCTIKQVGNRFHVYHFDGTLLITTPSKSDAIDFLKAYTDPNINW